MGRNGSINTYNKGVGMIFASQIEREVSEYVEDNWCICLTKIAWCWTMEASANVKPSFEPGSDLEQIHLESNVPSASLSV